MKRKILTLALFAFVASANAQSLKDVISNITSNSKSTVGQTVGQIVDKAATTKNLTVDKIAGTWKYKQPAVVFEGKNTLSSIGGSAATAKIEKTLGNSLAKAGITPEKFSITFKADGTFTTKLNSRTMNGVYTLKDSTITFAKSNEAKSRITANICKGTTLQITFKADKLLQFVKQFASYAGSVNASLATISSLAKNYEGMEIGLRLEK